MMIRQQAVAQPQLAQYCAWLRDDQGCAEIFVACDPAAPFQAIATALEAIRETGINVNLLTAPGDRGRSEIR